jgi:hypothetical protein
MGNSLTLSQSNNTLRVIATSKIVEVVIFDFSGSLILIGYSEDIDTSKFSKGSYFITVKTENDIFLDKFKIE